MSYYNIMTKKELISALKIAEKEISKLRNLNHPRWDAYACQRCGRRDSMDAVVNDEIWKQISPKKNGGGTLCLWCMDALCLEKGISGKVQLHFPGWALVGN